MTGKWNESQIQETMTENIRGKFKYLASKCPGMLVHQLGTIQYVDCLADSDTFNTVFGRPESNAEAEAITTYYRNRTSPAAWWLSPENTDEGTRKLLTSHGWSQEEREIGMFHLLPQALPEPEASALTVTRCRTAGAHSVFGQVLASIFEDGNPSEAENVRAVYARAGEAASTAAMNDMVLLNGYEEGHPVATAAVFFTGDVAGIFDIATHPLKRNRGFGSVMFSAALQVASQEGAKLCVLQASPDGLTIYRRAGFSQLGVFEVWNLAKGHNEAESPAP